MQKTIIWKGLDADTVESCTVVIFTSGEVAVRSEITGRSDGGTVKVQYVLKLDSQWQVKSIALDSAVGGTASSYCLERDSADRWVDASGLVLPEFEGCRYIDISFTPLTNSLPINGLHLKQDGKKEIDVVYFDVEEHTVRRDSQQYTRLNRLKYRFENDSGNFFAEIEVDEDGFVTTYPHLFKML